MRSTSPAQFLSALTCALVPEMPARCGDRRQTDHRDRAIAATGLFGSKNFFAQHISLMMFACIGTLTQRRQPGWGRTVALAGLLSGPFLLLACQVDRCARHNRAVPVGHGGGSLVEPSSHQDRPLAIFGYVFVLSIMVALIVIAVTTDGT